MGLQFIMVKTDEQIHKLASTAKEIWEQHFTPIIGKKQVAYMLERFQSFHAIKKAIYEEGYQYYFLMYDGDIAGYTGFQFKDNHTLFLSKLYLKEEYRGKKLARKALEFLEQLAGNHACTSIWLTCNRGNENTLKVYDKMGFQIVRDEDTDIGGGFFMTDHIMEKKLV